MKKYIYSVFVTLVAVLSLPAISFAEHPGEAIKPGEIGKEVKTTAETEHECHFEGNLALGVKSEDVECLQTFLHEAGFLGEGLSTGYFGALTTEALKAWQGKMNLPATGYFGPMSREKAKHEKEEKEKKEGTAMPATEAGHSEGVVKAEHPATFEVPVTSPAPAVSLELFKDSMSGYNLKVSTTNFTIAPDHAGGLNVVGEGHMHLYVNGKKIARVYGNWFHIPGEVLKKGENTVRVTLNANTHAEYTLVGKSIEAVKTVVVE